MAPKLVVSLKQGENIRVYTQPDTLAKRLVGYTAEREEASKLLAPAHRRRNRYRPGEQHLLIPIEDDDHIKREPSNDRKGRGDPTCS